jgi:hypothetical protein
MAMLCSLAWQLAQVSTVTLEGSFLAGPNLDTTFRAAPHAYISPTSAPQLQSNAMCSIFVNKLRTGSTSANQNDARLPLKHDLSQVTYVPQMQLHCKQRLLDRHLAM